MKLKKNPKTDLNRNRSLFFVTGLMMVMALTYIALEWKTYDESFDYTQAYNIGNPIIEEEPPIIITPPSPPLKPVAPDLIEVVPDDLEAIETVFKSTETDQEAKIIAVDSIPEIDEPIEVNVTWVTIEEVPVFPGCEDATDKRACFQKMITKHVRKTQRYPEAAQDIGAEGRVSTIFTIQDDGTIGTVRMRGPHKSLEKEASRIISKLPKMRPGKQRGTPVKVSFSLPINFQLQ